MPRRKRSYATPPSYDLAVGTHTSAALATVVQAFRAAGFRLEGGTSAERVNMSHGSRLADFLLDPDLSPAWLVPALGRKAERITATLTATATVDTESTIRIDATWPGFDGSTVGGSALDIALDGALSACAGQGWSASLSEGGTAIG